MVLELAFHSGYVTPESASQGRNGRSKQSRTFLPSVAGAPKRQNRTTSFAEQPHNLFKLQAGVDLSRPRPIDGPVRELLHSSQRFNTPQLSQTATEGPMEGKHQQAVNLSRKHQDATAIKIARNLSYRALHELSCVAAVTGDRLCRLAGTVPDAMRRSPHIRPNRSPGVVGVFVPPKCNF
jgi:hypothetical protein